MKKSFKINTLLLLFVLVTSGHVFAQDKDTVKVKEKERTEASATNFVYDANEFAESDNFIYAEKEYRKAISKAPSVVAGSYNLGNSYYEKGNYDEALYRHTQAIENATNKAEKHKAYHNIGNILMKKEQCKEAVEAFKNALRNDPTDDETRYNFALAKKCAEEQQDNKKEQEEEEQDEKKEDEKKDDQQQDDQKKDDPKDNGDQDKKEGDDQKNEDGKPKEEKDKGDGEQKKDKDQQGKPKPKQGQLSPQQIKNLLEAMNNQERKVQEKINAEKQKGVKVKPEKDW